jgi:hypothetical protein
VGLVAAILDYQDMVVSGEVQVDGADGREQSVPGVPLAEYRE